MRNLHVKNRHTTSEITITAVMAAFIFLGTYFLKIPTFTGYIHLGDCLILLTVALFGKKKGAAAGAIGCGLADLLGGYVYWVLPTLLIKCMWALVLGSIMHKTKKNGRAGFVGGAIVGGILQIAAYTAVSIFYYGMFAALAELPALSLQTGAGVILSFVIYQAMAKSGLVSRLKMAEH